MTRNSSEAAGGAGETDARLGLARTGVGQRHDSPDPGGAGPGDEPAADGRRARGQRTRRNVAEALMDLLGAGDPDPTARAVAQRAGVSLRLVFHHFSDMDDLYHFVAALQLRRLWSELPPRPPRLSTDRWIERFVTQRAALYEEMSPVRRALVRRTATSPGVRDALAAADGLLLEHLKATFGPELDALAPTDRHDSVAALDTASSWEAWERLRATSGLGVRPARRVVARMLAAHCPPPAAAGRRRAAATPVPGEGA